MSTSKTPPVMAEELQAATAALNGLRGKLEAAKAEMPQPPGQATKVGPKKVQLVARRLEATRQHREALPPAFDVRQFERDATLLFALDACRTALEQALEEVNEAASRVGRTAVEASRAAFVHLQVVASGAGQMTNTVRGLVPKLKAGRRNREQAAEAIAAAAPPASPSPAPAPAPAASAPAPASATPAAPEAPAKVA